MPIRRKNKEGGADDEEAAASPDGGGGGAATAVTAAASSEVTTTKRTLNRKGRGGKSTTETVTETEIIVEEAATGSCAEELKKLKKEMEAKERMITMLKERAKEEEEAKEKEEARVSELLFKMEELEALVDSKVIGAVSDEAEKNEPIVKGLRDDIREGRLELKAVKDAWKLNRKAWAKKWGETQELYMLSAHFHPWYFFFKTGSARGIRADASKKSVTINEASLTKKGASGGGGDGDRGGGGGSSKSSKNRRSRRDDSDSGSGGDDSGSSDSTRQGRRGGGGRRGRRRRRDEERNPIETLFGDRGDPHRMTRGISPLAQRILDTRSRSPAQPAYPTLFPPSPSRHSPYPSAQGSPPYHDGGYPASSLGTGMDNLAIQQRPQTRVVQPQHGSSPYPYDGRAGSPLDEHQRTPPHATYGHRSPSPGPSHTPFTGHVLNGLRGSSVPVYDGQPRGSPAGFVHPDPHGFEHAAPHGGATSANTSGIYVPGGNDGGGWPLEESMLRPDRIINSDNSNLYHIPSIMAPSPLGRTSTTQPAPRSGAVSYAGDDYARSGRRTSSPKPLDPVFRSEVMASPLNSRVSDLPSTGHTQSHAAPSVDLSAGKRRAARAAAASVHPAGAVCAEKAAGGHEVFSGSLRADLLPIAARLSALYKAKSGTVLDELAANLVSDVSLSSSTAKDSSRQLHKDIFAEAATELVQTKSGQYPGASELDLLLMRLYTMAGPDIDKLMLFDDVPEFSASPLSQWASYNKTHRDRNAAIFSQINRALRQVASDDAAEESKGWATLGKWVKTTCHLHRLCGNVQLTHDATSAPLMRGVTGLPPTAVSEHTILQAQQEITWPALSSCTTDPNIAIDYIMGNAANSSKHLKSGPSSVLFSVSGRVPALHLQHISQYPAEAEVLVPPLSVLSVRSAAPHSPDPSCHSLSMEWDHSVPLAGLDGPLRADEQRASQFLSGRRGGGSDTSHEKPLLSRQRGGVSPLSDGALTRARDSGMAPYTSQSSLSSLPLPKLGIEERRAARAAAISAHPAGAVCAEKAAGGHEVFSGSLQGDLLGIAARLSSLYKAKSGTVLDELAANLVSDVSLSSSTAKDSSRQHHKLILTEAATELVQTKGGLYPGASELDLLLMRLYTMAGPDIDKLMLFKDVPDYSGSSQSQWAVYKKTQQNRNAAIFSQINRALRQVASDDAAEESKGWATLGKWVKTTCHLHRLGNVQLTHDATSEPLMRGVTGLPPTAVSEHTILQAQQEITWPAPSSCTSNQSVAIDAVMGNATASSSHPSSVLFSVSGRVPALHLQHISQYPAEAEVLVPPLSVLSVRSAAPHSPDPSCHSLSMEWDHSVPLTGLDGPLRADEQLSSQALAGPGGSTRMGVPAPYTPTHGDRDAAASLLFRQRSSFAPQAPAGSPQPSRAASRYDDPAASARTPQNSRAASRANLSERLPGDGPADSETAALLLSCQQVAFDTAGAPRDDDILASHRKGSVSSRIPFVTSVLGEPEQGGSDEHAGAAQPPSGAESSLASRPVHPSFASHASHTGYEDSLALSQTQPHDGRLRHTGGGGGGGGGRPRGEPVSPLTPARLRGNSTVSALSVPRSVLSRSGHRDSLAVSPVGETQDYYFRTPQKRSGGRGRGPSSIRSADSAFSQVRVSHGSPVAPRSGGSLRSRRANSVGRERSPSTRSLRVALEATGDGLSPEGRGSPLQYRMAHLHRGVEVRLTGAADQGGCLRGDETGFVIERDEWCPLRPFCVKGPRYDVFWYRTADIELCDGQEGADGPSELSFDEKLAMVMPPGATRSPAAQRASQAGNAGQGQGQGSPLRDRMPEVQRGVHVQLTESAEPGGSLVHGELGVVVERDEWCPFRPFCVKGPRYDVHWYRAVDILVVPHP